MLSLLVIQPTPFCNLDCDYCYLPNRQSHHRTSADTVDQIFRRVFESRHVGKRLGVVWHAGEPLAMPIAFYDAAFRSIQNLTPAHLEIVHSMQTNATLIDREWCAFIRAHRIQMGVSIDGPAFIHDRHRKTRSGKGTHDRVMHGIRLLQEHAIEFHVIAVLTADSLDAPDEIFQFFVDNHLYQFGFNVEEVEGVNRRSSLTDSGIEHRYRTFMKRIQVLANAAGGHVRVRELDRAGMMICQPLPPATSDGSAVEINHQVDPFGIITVDTDGNFSTFSPELIGQESPEYGNFVLGNVWHDSFDSVVGTDRFRRIHQDIVTGVDLCRRTCQYFKLCGGGAPANKYFERGSFTAAETMYCRLGIQVPIDVTLEYLEASLGVGSGPIDPAAGNLLATT